MTSAELKGLIKDAEYLSHRDVVFAHILIGMVVALENIREELITPYTGDTAGGGDCCLNVRRYAQVSCTGLRSQCSSQPS